MISTLWQNVYSRDSSAYSFTVTAATVTSQRASVTYAESSVMWFSRVFEQFPHEALVISELRLHADALPPACTGRTRGTNHRVHFYAIREKSFKAFAGESWVLLFPCSVIRRQQRRDHLCAETVKVAVLIHSEPPFKLDCAATRWISLLSLICLCSDIYLDLDAHFFPFTLHLRNIVWQSLRHCSE